ncbi:predicted protein [Brucella abortus bv. 3 str. Tulya]|nr:predicted protein [Brucella abortus bv. 3 str. Tulya]
MSCGDYRRIRQHTEPVIEVVTDISGFISGLPYLTPNDKEAGTMSGVPASLCVWPGEGAFLESDIIAFQDRTAFPG